MTRFFVTITSVLILATVSSADYQYPYQQYQQQYYDDQVIIIGIPIAPDYYYSVGEGDTEERDKRIAEAVAKRLEEKFSPGQNKVEGASPTPKAGREKFRLLDNGGAVEQLNGKILALFNTSCIKCHKPGATKPGNIQLFTADRKLFVDSDPKKEAKRRERVYESVESGDMPKNGQSLPTSLKALLREWSGQERVKK